jgi:hypothetical protein
LTRHSWALILVILLAACTTAGGSPAPSTSTTTSTTSSTTTILPPTTTTLPPTTTTTRPAPVTSPPPPPVPRATACPPEIVALIEKHWSRFGPDVVQWAIGIAWRESNCRPDVVSPGQCFSVLQLALPLHAGFYAAAGYPDWYAVRFDAEANIAAAALLYASAGSSPWRL